MSPYFILLHFLEKERQLIMTFHASVHHGIYTLITSLSDIDECSTSVGSCRGDQECVNTIGSYMCAAVCRRGFKRSKDGQQCIGMFAFFFRILSLDFVGFTQI